MEGDEPAIPYPQGGDGKGTDTEGPSVSVSLDEDLKRLLLLLEAGGHVSRDTALPLSGVSAYRRFDSEDEFVDGPDLVAELVWSEDGFPVVLGHWAYGDGSREKVTLRQEAVVRPDGGHEVYSWMAEDILSYVAASSVS